MKKFFEGERVRLIRSYNRVAGIGCVGVVKEVCSNCYGDSYRVDYYDEFGRYTMRYVKEDDIRKIATAKRVKKASTKGEQADVDRAKTHVERRSTCMKAKVKKYIGRIARSAADWLVFLLTGRGAIAEEAEALGLVSYGCEAAGAVKRTGGDAAVREDAAMPREARSGQDRERDTPCGQKGGEADGT